MVVVWTMGMHALTHTTAGRPRTAGPELVEDNERPPDLPPRYTWPPQHGVIFGCCADDSDQRGGKPRVGSMLAVGSAGLGESYHQVNALRLLRQSRWPFARTTS
jgi:hypothetical protein